MAPSKVCKQTAQSRLAGGGGMTNQGGIGEARIDVPGGTIYRSQARRIATRRSIEGVSG
jgi:hypothetical protein